MHVLHGFAYSGTYTNTTWPSYTTFTYRFSEMWNQHQPSWLHINESIHYISRNQYVSQTGTPNVDLAFYLYEAPWTVSAKYEDSSLETLGYTYEYLSSNNLQEPDAVVEDGILAPSRQSFKALIFSNASAITPGGAAQVQEFAEAGLPIFFVGATTNLTSIGQEAGAATEVASTISSILSSGFANVHTVATSADLPDALASAGIQPRVSFANATSWYSFWRRGGDDGLDYAFIYNDAAEAQTVDVTFATAGTPYVFDAWTGAITPVLQYTTTGGSTTTIPLTLASNQTTIIAFASANATTTAAADSLLHAAPATHVTAASGGLARLTTTSSSSSNSSDSGSGIAAYLTGPASLTLASGEVRNLTASPLPATTLAAWDIAIADWHRTDDAFSMETDVTWHNYTNTTLAPWTELADGEGGTLAGVSGVGTYRTTFVTPASSGGEGEEVGLGAVLSLGPVANSMRAWVNGVSVGPLDVAGAVADVSGLIRGGAGEVNEVVVEVTTTLFNRIKADGNATWSVGVTANEENDAYYEVNAAKVYGLLGPVVVEWVGVVGVV